MWNWLQNFFVKVDIFKISELQLKKELNRDIKFKEEEIRERKQLITLYQLDPKTAKYSKKLVNTLETEIEYISKEKENLEKRFDLICKR